jgi:lipoprotein-anchoring transpeptidase ErfK/SrfK
MITEMSQKLVFSGKHFEGDSLTDKYQIMSGDRLSRIADRHGTTWELLCKVNELSDPKRIRAGQYIKIINGPFFAVVNKSKFRLDVYLGNAGGPGSTFVMSLPVGLGKDNSTPTGMWMVQSGNKVHPATYYSPRGEGVIAADDPRNPLGGYWMGISGLDGQAVGKTSYGIHGTIDPDSIGKQASLGCIRLRHDDIAFLYDLLVEGKSKVMVKD